MGSRPSTFCFLLHHIMFIFQEGKVKKKHGVSAQIPTMSQSHAKEFVEIERGLQNRGCSWMGENQVGGFKGRETKSLLIVYTLVLRRGKCSNP